MRNAQHICMHSLTQAQVVAFLNWIKWFLPAYLCQLSRSRTRCKSYEFGLFSTFSSIFRFLALRLGELEFN